MKSKILAAAILFVFLYHTAGYFFAFKILQAEAKKEAQIKLKKISSDEKMLVLSFHPGNQEINRIVWLKDNEFRYEGHMYDVARVETEPSGTVRYYCLIDRKEDNINESFKRHSGHDDPSEQPGKSSQQLIQSLLQSYLAPGKNPLIIPKVHRQIFFNHTQSFYLIYSEIPSPPPKQA